jgi:nicotinamidase-related amidase
MNRIRALFGALALVCSGAAAKAQAPTGAGGTAPKLTIEMPALPKPAAVRLAPRSTAILVADMVGSPCGKQPNCTGQMIARIADLLARARRAGVFVIYSIPRESEKVLPGVSPASGDPVVLGHAQDRFWQTNLDDLLKSKGIETLILTGWKIDGSVLYTSVAATERGYTVVIPVDASLAPTDYDIAIGQFQALTQLNGNRSNTPLKQKAATLSRTDLIAFR